MKKLIVLPMFLAMSALAITGCSNAKQDMCNEMIDEVMKMATAMGAPAGDMEAARDEAMTQCMKESEEKVKEEYEKFKKALGK